MMRFKFFCEKIFDGNFNKKSEQDEAMEQLQLLGKMVDSRKVREDRIALRNGIFVLFKRPMSALESGFIIAQIVDDSISPAVGTRLVSAKIIKNYSAPSDFRVGSSVELSVIDALAVSDDNKRYYIVYPAKYEMSSVDDADSPKNGNGKKKDKDDDDSVSIITKGDDEKSMMQKIKAMEGKKLFEKYLSNDEIQDLIDSIKSKLKNRTDTDARGMYNLTKDIEKTLKVKGKLHPNSVIAIQRIATGVAGSWGKNSKDWTGKPPSGRLNKYPPSPTQYARS